MGTENNLCNDSMGIPSLFPPPGSVQFEAHAHRFLDLLALASNMACHFHGWFYYNYIFLKGQELDQKEFEKFKGAYGS